MMKGSAWIISSSALVIWLAAIGWPALACVGTILVSSDSAKNASATSHSTLAQLLIVSITWAGMVAIGAMLLGWLPGRLLGRTLARSSTRHSSRSWLVLATLLLVPICLPAYVVFFAWWQAWPADSWLFRWALEHQQVQTVRYATLLAGLLCWSWPIVSWCVAGFAANTPAHREEMLLLDGARPLTRLLDKLRCDGRGLLLGGLIVFLAAFSNTTVFDLAEIFTFGNELRAIEALGATPREVLTTAALATVLTVLGAIIVWILLSMRPAEIASARFTRDGRSRVGVLLFTVLLWLLSVGIPIVLLARNMRSAAGGRTFGEQLSEFTTFYGRGMGNTMVVAMICGALASMIAAGLAWMWQDRRAWVRSAAHAQAVGWMIAAAVPGTMIGSSLTVAYNRGWLADWVYLTPAVLVIGHLARFGFLAALLGRWIAQQEPRALVEMRAMDGAERLGGLLRATWPRLLAAGGATFAIVMALSLAEIPVTAQVRPPGFDLITPSILNDMHYQRPQTVMIATAAFMGVAMLASFGALVLWSSTRRAVNGVALR